MRRLHDGSIGMAFNYRESASEATRRFQRSTDEGENWTAPVTIAPGGYRTGGHDRLTTLASGRILAPLHCTDHWDSHYLYVRVGRSDDLGASWSLSGKIELPAVAMAESGCIEPDIVERSDGSLLMILRTAMGTIFRTESHDDGSTWGHLRSMEVTAPIAPSIIRRIPESDDLLLIWNWVFDPTDPMGGRRRRLSCALSRDGGNSWPLTARKVLELDPEDCFAYPSCMFYENHVLLTYYHMHSDVAFNFDGPRSLKLMRIPVEWLYG
jgi:sialidase-1